MAYGGGSGLGCLTSARFSMSADVLIQSDKTDDPINPDAYGSWENSQDPLTLEIVRIWVYDETAPKSSGDTPTVRSVPCLARGIVDGGIRVAGTTERVSDIYENIDYVKLWIPPNVTLTKRDRVTNIRDASGHIRWLDEEFSKDGAPPKATVFNVNGVTPLFDAFNNVVEQFVLLEKAEVDGVT